MLDVLPLAKATLLAAFVAAAVMQLGAWRAPYDWVRDACWAWAVGAGVLAASGATDQWPHWPPLEDRARFLTLLVPLTLAVETLAAIVRSRGWRWLLRLALAAVATPILLHNSIYLAALNGPDSAEWSAVQATTVLCGLGALLALVWAVLTRLQSRTSTQAVMWGLALDALAAAVTVMLSGYYRAGLLGLGLAGAGAGATVTSHFNQRQLPKVGSLAMSIIGIFAVVLMGRLFGALSTGLAACLLLAPLLAWTFELPLLSRMAPGWRNSGQFMCVAIPLLLVVILAQRRFMAASTERHGPSRPSTVQDLLEK